MRWCHSSVLSSCVVVEGHKAPEKSNTHKNVNKRANEAKAKNISTFRRSVNDEMKKSEEMWWMHQSNEKWEMSVSSSSPAASLQHLRTSPTHLTLAHHPSLDSCQVPSRTQNESLNEWERDERNALKLKSYQNSKENSTWSTHVSWWSHSPHSQRIGLSPIIGKQSKSIMNDPRNTPAHDCVYFRCEKAKKNFNSSHFSFTLLTRNCRVSLLIHKQRFKSASRFRLMLRPINSPQT